MLRTGITIGCAAALVAAAVLVVRLRLTERTPSPLTGQDPFAERLAVTVGRTGGMLVGAYLAGVLVIGAGARLMMRVLAVTSPEEVQGLRTEADEIVGDVTFGGSAFLIVALGLGAGVVGLALFAALRRWLPGRSLVAGVIGSAIGAGLLVRPSGFLSAGNVDFAILQPVGLAVASCLVIIVLFGATFGVLVDRLAPRWPRPGWSLRGVASILPFAVLLLSPPLLLAALAGVFFGTVAPTLPRSVASQRQVPAAAGDEARLGHLAVIAAGAPVVLVFYPADNSPVCTVQLSAYSADIGRFAEVGVQVLAISPQSVEEHEEFAEAHGPFAFPLLSDEDKEVARSYDILGPIGFYRRSVVVIDPEGVVRWVHRATAGLTFRPVDEIVAAVEALGA